LTEKERGQVHELMLAPGRSYVIDLHSTDFDAYLKLLDGKGKVLAENDDITPNNLDSRLIFTPNAHETFRIVATSFQERGRGAYVLTIRAFSLEAKAQTMSTILFLRNGSSEWIAMSI
jgi:hypothetical protein